MKLQFDTTIFFHKSLKKPYDDIADKLAKIKNEAESLHSSTFVKKEYLATLIYDYCTFQSKLYTTRSLWKSHIWLKKRGHFRKRIKERLDEMVILFMIRHNRPEFNGLTDLQRDAKLAEILIDYLRILIPELYETFEEDLNLPLDDRTHCPFAKKELMEMGEIFSIEAMTANHTCNSKHGCAISKLLKGEKKRALKLLAVLRGVAKTSKTPELNAIEEFLESFFENGDVNLCYGLCSKGIGDLIIAIETLPDRTFTTTNFKEAEIICPAILQNYHILKEQ